MKFFLFLMSLSTICLAQSDWKIVAESNQCSEKIQILAKDGEKYVLVQSGENKIKLNSLDNSDFQTDSPKSITFKSDQYQFDWPAMMERNPPKLSFLKSRNKQACRMVTK
ncbi:MAG: hypothetical protein AB7I27_07175 [Bacteriovoracaceae bacterium]